MILVDLKPRVVKFIKKLPPKHKEQIKKYILNLQKNPIPQDARPLIGYTPYVRADIGEYRIIYRYNQKSKLIIIVLVGKRNDSEIYRIAKRIFKN